LTRLRVIDLETTGTEPPAEIIEFGRVDVEIGQAGTTVEPPLAWLYRPLRGIPPETMAVHHITDADFAPDTPVCTPEHLRSAVWSGQTPAAFVAHSCAFERQFITEAITGVIPWICTYKVAMHVWPDAPRHSNQVLRYWRNLVLDNALAMPPHRAGPDAWVTAHLLADLAQHATIEQMVAWTREPRPMPKLTFGKHRGQAWAQVPMDYLRWMLGQNDMDPDTLWHARQELDQRTGNAR
jgi:exodeoxyribonuclease X